LVVPVTAAASVTFFRPEFDDFLYAPVGADRDEMPLTVLSALSRLNVDPWQEAAELSELPKDTAARRLASLIARLPARPSSQVDPTATADRLIELLPRRSKPSTGSGGKANVRRISASTVVLICAALGLGALMIAANFERSARRDDARLPEASRSSPPQTFPQ
jgi:hypothetical protein